MTNQVKIFVSIIGLLILGTVAAVLIQSKPAAPVVPSKYVALAQCIKDSGATFYGAFWCPHCQAQEKDFGMTRQDLASIGLYTECSTPDASGQTPICISKGIKSYPTWIFKDGSQLSGEIPLTQLAQKAGCTVPQ